jgi:hypothetical protein
MTSSNVKSSSKFKNQKFQHLSGDIHLAFASLPAGRDFEIQKRGAL